MWVTQMSDDEECRQKHLNLKELEHWLCDVTELIVQKNIDGLRLLIFNTIKDVYVMFK